MLKIVKQPISPQEVKAFLGNPYSEMIKFVVDIEKGILALGGELHADSEALLLEGGSRQEDVWGGNYYPGRAKGERVEFTAMINIRPSLKNLSMEVKDEKIREQMKKRVETLLEGKGTPS